MSEKRRAQGSDRGRAAGVLADLFQLFEMGGGFAKEIVPTEEYTVVIPDWVRKGIESGELWLNERTDGSGTLPQVMHINKDGRRVVKKNLTIRKRQPETVREVEGRLGPALEHAALRSQVASLEERVVEVQRAAERIEAGQRAQIAGLIAGSIDTIRDALAMDGPDSARGLLEKAVQDLNVGASTVEGVIRDRVESLGAIPTNALAIRVKIYMDPDYRIKCNREFGIVQEFIGLLVSAREAVAAAYVLMGERDVADRSIERLRVFLHGLDARLFKGFRAINPGHDFSGEWFDDPDAFVDGECARLPLLAGDGSVELTVSGEDLLEVLGNGRS